MNMAIDPANVNVPNNGVSATETPATTASGTPSAQPAVGAVPNQPAMAYRLDFSVYAANLAEAATYFRAAVSVIPSLTHSLLGRKPLCADEIGLDLSRHQKMRDFSDQKGMEAFCKYLSEVIAGTEKQHPQFARHKGGLQYTTSTEMASVTLRPSKGGAWSVSGWALFRDSRIAQRNLGQKGFKVWRRRVPEKVKAQPSEVADSAQS